MPPRIGKVSSRQGKMQVAAFLSDELVQAAYSLAARRGKTNAEIIADAINAVFVAHGLAPSPVAAHERLVRRGVAKAAVRLTGQGPGCRAGKLFYGGWLDAAVVKRLNEFAASESTSAWSKVEEGLKLLIAESSAGHASPPAPAAENASF